MMSQESGRFPIRPDILSARRQASFGIMLAVDEEDRSPSMSRSRNYNLASMEVRL
jgi:hypothetical protein